MKLHYFDQEKADEDDMLLGMAIQQGYVPKTCLLGGMTIIAEVQEGISPCAGCNCDRAKCLGKPHQDNRRWNR